MRGVLYSTAFQWDGLCLLHKIFEGLNVLDYIPNAKIEMRTLKGVHACGYRVFNFQEALI